MPQLMVQDGEKLGRRKAMAGSKLFIACYTQPFLPFLPFLTFLAFLAFLNFLSFFSF
jgi:hypothetical protein